jgi:hypothetical protein
MPCPHGGSIDTVARRDCFAIGDCRYRCRAATQGIHARTGMRFGYYRATIPLMSCVWWSSGAFGIRLAEGSWRICVSSRPSS